MTRQFFGLRLLLRNLRALFLFELAYKCAASLLATPFLLLLFHLSMRAAGLKYLSNDNVLTFLTAPLPLCMLFLLAVLLSVFMLIETGAILQCFAASRRGERITVTAMFRTGVSRALHVVRARNLLLLPFILLLIPLIGVVPLSGYLSSLRIPEFIMHTIQAQLPLFLAFCALMALLTLMLMRWVFALHYVLLEGEPFPSACRKSAALMRGRYLKNLVALSLWGLLLLVVVAVFFAVLIGLVCLVAGAFVSRELVYTLLLGAAGGVMLVLPVLSMLFGTPAMLAFLSAVYYREREARGETPSDAPLPSESPQAARVLRRVLCVLVIFTLGNNVFLAAFRATGNAATAELLTRPTITAHRGDSAVAPENTLPAFESAIHNLADFAELDVQLSRDGVPVVIHDYDLKRLAGTDRQVSELTLRELKQLDVGRWFSPAYQNTRIPTLDEVIRATKGRIKLNIELKPSALPGLEAAVVEVIRAHNLESDCVVASLYYDCLQRVHALAPELKTVYVTAVAYGNFDELDAADVISMESTFVTPSLVDRIKSSGREVYVWTVNHESRIQLMLESGVDSVITDDPVKARAILYAEYAPSFLTQLIRMLQAL